MTTRLDEARNAEILRKKRIRDALEGRAPDVLAWLEANREHFGKVRLLHVEVPGVISEGKPINEGVPYVPSRDLKKLRAEMKATSPVYPERKRGR